MYKNIFIHCLLKKQCFIIKNDLHQACMEILNLFIRIKKKSANKSRRVKLIERYSIEYDI